MIKVVSFDLGGVLFTEGKTVALGKLAHDFGNNPEPNHFKSEIAPAN